MAQGQVSVLLCLGMLGLLKTVLGAYNVSIYIPDDDVYHVDDGTLDRTKGTITVSKEVIKNDFKCTKGQPNTISMLAILNGIVSTTKMKIEVAFGDKYYEFGTITEVGPNNGNGVQTSCDSSTTGFTFTYALDVDRNEWLPCFFAYDYFGFRNKTTREILLTYTQVDIDDLISRSSKDWICMRDINADGNAYEDSDYVIRGLDKKSDKDVNGNIKAYILSYSELSKLELI